MREKAPGESYLFLGAFLFIGRKQGKDSKHRHHQRLSNGKWGLVNTKVVSYYQVGIAGYIQGYYKVG